MQSFISTNIFAHMFEIAYTYAIRVGRRHLPESFGYLLTHPGLKSILIMRLPIILLSLFMRNMLFLVNLS